MSESVSRATCEHEVRYGRFVLKKTDYVQQFCHMYSRRLAQMRAPLVRAAEEKWGLKSKGIKVLEKIIESETSMSDSVVLVGTVYKEMELKPSVLDAYKEKNGVLGGMGGAKKVKNFASEGDVLLLEDESGRARLAGMEQFTASLVTGVTIAIKGCVKEDGSFHVQEHLTMGEYLPPAARESSGQTQAGEPRYVLLASGLEVGAQDSSLTAVQLLVDFVCGKLGGPEQQALSSRIVRVVLAGNSMGASPARLSGMERFTNPELTKKNKQTIEDFQSSSSRRLDALLCQIAVTCPVDVMPGDSDPANIIMPQQPMHPCMLPNCSRFSTMALTTNPYEAQCGGRVLLGHSGQPLKDMLLQVPEDTDNAANTMDMDSGTGTGADPAADTSSARALKLLEQAVRWGNLCPTSPDSLPCYPFLQEDPFVMDALPDVVFAGTMGSYATSMVDSFAGAAAKNHRTRCILVPSFKARGEVVLLDLTTLDTKVVTFNV